MARRIRGRYHVSVFRLALMTFLSALATAVATGTGAVPFLFTPGLPARVLGLAWGFSGGMMLSASVFTLVFEDVTRDGYTPVAAGIALGAALFWFAERWFGRFSFNLLPPARDPGAPDRPLHRDADHPQLLRRHRRGGGVWLGRGHPGRPGHRGHRHPQHPRRARRLPAAAQPRFSGWACIGCSIFTKLPQPLMAVPASLAVAFFEPLVTVGLGFAAGAMAFLVFSEIIPEAEKHSGRGNGAAAVIAGFLTMMVMQNVLQ